jgi:DNA-binding transcriptional regulator YiaG
LNATITMTSKIAALRTQLSAKELANAIDTPSAEVVRRWGRGEAQPSAKYEAIINKLFALYTREFGDNK